MTPPADRTIDHQLVAELAAVAGPPFADAPIAYVGHGWDNELYRLGDDHVMRLPRRVEAVELIRSEQRWLPALAQRVDVPIPAPVHAGEPVGRWDRPWSICPWIDGSPAIGQDLRSATGVADQLGRFVTAVRTPAPIDAPPNRLRGIPLADRGDVTPSHIERIGHVVDATEMHRAWERALDAEPYDGPPVWLHGDLHPANLIADGDRLVGVIDFGDLTSGDPASDLGVAWMLFDHPTRAHFRRAAGVDDDATWSRGRGWALAIAAAVLAIAGDDGPMAAMARATIAAVLTDPD